MPARGNSLIDHRGGLALLAVVALVLVTASGCTRQGDGQSAGTGDAPPASQARVLRRGLGGEPGTLDPHQADDTFAFEVLRALYEGLTVSAPNGDVVPGSAASWSVDTSGRRWVFRLRDGLQWSDGTPLLASHFVAGLRRAVDPATASPGADLLRVIGNADDIIEGRKPPTDLQVVAVDDRHVAITTTRPTLYLPDILTNSIAMPLHPAGPPRARSPATIVNGAFAIASAEPGRPIVLRPNARYWNAAGVALDEVRFLPLPDETVEFNRFRAGDLDMTNTVPASRFPELSQDPSSGLQHRPTLATFFFAFNAEQGPLARNPELREALSLSIDRESIATLVTRAGQEPAYSFVPPGVWNYQPRSAAWRELDRPARVQRAKALLAAAGYSPDRPLRLRVVYNQNELIKAVTLATAAMWREVLGVECELIQLEYRAYLDARPDRSRWDVIRLGWSADFNDASSFLDTLASNSAQNHGAWRSESYDRLLEAAHAEPDASRRRERLQQAEEVALQASAIAPVYFYVTRRLVRAGVQGAELNPLNRNYSRNIRIAPAG